MRQAIQRTERAIKNRRNTDKSLVNWWLYVLLLSWITAGIYSIVVYYQRLKRVTDFIERRKKYYNGVLNFTENYAKEEGEYDDIVNELNDLNDDIKFAFGNKVKKFNPLVDTILSVVTFGIYGIYIWYRLNKVWYELQLIEQDFNDDLSKIWSKLNLIKNPFNYNVDSSRDRNFWLYLLLTFVTVGIWGLVWDYKIHTDPDNLYEEFHFVEDEILQIIRNAG
ncbi:MAG: DUF4234 domain-containing protein [archaeon]